MRTDPRPLPLLFALALAPSLACAQAPAPAAAKAAATYMPTLAGRQDMEAMRAAAEQFLRQQTEGVPGRIEITVGKVDQRTLPEACPQLEAYFPQGSRPWGNTSVGVRCNAPKWQRYLQARVTIHGRYVATAVPVSHGQTLSASQLTLVEGELTALPYGVLTDTSQAEGRILTRSLLAGAPLRADALRNLPVILQGQQVQLVSSGNGFRVSTEVRALGNATEGQVVQVRTQSGKQLSGIARAGGLVEVPN